MRLEYSPGVLFLSLLDVVLSLSLLDVVIFLLDVVLFLSLLDVVLLFEASLLNMIRECCHLVL